MTLSPDEHRRLVEFGIFIRERDPQFAHRLDLVAAVRRRRIRARLGRLSMLLALVLTPVGIWMTSANLAAGVTSTVCAVVLLGAALLVVLTNESRGPHRRRPGHLFL